MMPAIVFLCIVVGVVVGYTVVSRRHRSNYLALTEYWVYIPDERLPSQEAIMRLMAKESPFELDGRIPITPKEAILFSDVRLDMALVLRSKNPHVFRPDQFGEHIQMEPGLQSSLQSSNAMVKLRYASDRPLSNRIHLQFMTYLADAVAEIGHGSAIFDAKADMLMSRGTLRRLLYDNFDATVPDLHVHVVWKSTPQRGHVETKGLIKIGCAELKTKDVTNDQRIIATSIIGEAVRHIWESQTIPQTMDLEIYNDTFHLIFDPAKDSVAQVAIQRVQKN